jgi:tetratricopeptide (TPR) repeat protein
VNRRRARPSGHTNKSKRSGGKTPAEAGNLKAHASAIRLRLSADGKSGELVHPRCAVERREDIEEVEVMLAAGELEVARDELRWLLEGCGNMVIAHVKLGEIAMAEGDIPLARGHFGYACQICEAVLRPVPQVRLPCACEANRPFFEAAKGAVRCLFQLQRHRDAIKIAERMIELDPDDPLGFEALRREIVSQR